MRDYQFKSEPKLMQLYSLFRLKRDRIFGNWCGPGAGKTISALISGRETNSRVMVIICPNNVKSTWKKEIDNVYPNNTIKVNYHKISDIIRFDRNKFNYIIINYDKLSLNNKNYGKLMIDKLLSLNKIDFICIDEIHFVKSNDINESNRRECLKYFRLEAEKQNPNVYVYGMTATPLKNSIDEPKSLIELLTAKEYPEINGSLQIKNACQVNKWLTILGTRFMPNYGINVDEKFIYINGDELSNDIVNSKNFIDIESILVDKKLENEQIINELTPGTIIYCQYKKNIVNKVIKNLNKLNISYTKFTGDEDNDVKEYNLNLFKQRKVDILIATSSISTGVDGLQEISNKIIPISYPWSYAEWHQLEGRINRQGSNFDKVTIIHPQVYINTNNGEWSYDLDRWNKIKYKETLSNIVVDGELGSFYKLNIKKYIDQIINKLKEGIKDYHPERNDIKVNYTFTEQEYKNSESIIKDLHRKANTSTSKHMHNWFTNNPDDWKEYHKQREISKSKWLEDPVDVIAKELNERNDTNVIADLGCGLAKLSKIVKEPNKVISVDHYSEDPNVIKADIADLSQYINDNEVDFTVFCLSLWGTNYLDYIKEAYRITSKRGIMYIVEPIKNEKFDFNKLKEDVKRIGFNKINEVIRDKFIYLTFIKN